MFKASKLIKNLIFLLLFISSVSAHTEEQSLAEPQKPGQSQEIQSPSQEIPSLQQKQKISFFNAQNFNFKEKRIFSLYLLGYSYRQIGERMQISPKSADNALQRVKKKLRDSI